MSRRIRIDELTVIDVTKEVRDWLVAGLDAESIGEYLTAVDWSSAKTADPAVLRLLGELEQLSTSHAERDLSREEYGARLRAILAA